MPGTSSSSGSSADTSIIPMAVVERVEILRDGASAVYGSSAVAGVINIITKKDFDGVSVKYDYEVPKVEGGESKTFSITSGYTSEKGNIIFTYENSRDNAIFDKEIQGWTIQLTVRTAVIAMFQTTESVVRVAISLTLSFVTKQLTS